MKSVSPSFFEIPLEFRFPNCKFSLSLSLWFESDVLCVLRCVFVWWCCLLRWLNSFFLFFSLSSFFFW